MLAVAAWFARFEQWLPNIRIPRHVQWLTYWTILGGVTMTEGLVAAVIDRSALRGAHVLLSDFSEPFRSNTC